MSTPADQSDRPMETIYVVVDKAQYGKRHFAVAAYRDEQDAHNEAEAIRDHSPESSTHVDEVTLDGAVSANAVTGRDAYSPRHRNG